jgi:hypothetical protein
LRRGPRSKSLKTQSSLSVTFGTAVTTRPHGPPAEASVDLEKLAATLVGKLGPRRALLLAALLDEKADEAREDAT